MDFFALDLEFNKSQHKTRVMPFHILEIGAVNLNSEQNYEAFSVITNLMGNLSKKVINMTGITNTKANNAPYFHVGFNKFHRWVTFRSRFEIKCFVTWGKDDLGILYENCKFHNIGVAIITHYVDLQDVIMDLLILEKRIGLDRALKIFNIEHSPDKRHSALQDAVLLTKIFNMLTIEHKVDISKYVKRYAYSNNLIKIGKNGEFVLTKSCVNMLKRGYETISNNKEISWSKFQNSSFYKKFSIVKDVDRQQEQLIKRYFETLQSKSK